MVELHDREIYRVFAHRPYARPIAERLPSVRDREALAGVEALTNPRIQQEYARLRKVRPEDLAGFSGGEHVISTFQYAGASRFTDGTYGVFYAGMELATATRESAFHTERFLSATRTGRTAIMKRVLQARLLGAYDDVRSALLADPIYDPDPERYAMPQQYARRRYEENVVDGIVYSSVRAPGGTCAAIFRPNCIRRCFTQGFLLYLYDGDRVQGMYTLSLIPELEKEYSPPLD